MIVTGRPGIALPDHHAGYVAGRYRDGALSDTWTDIARCARGTFVRYVPACTCGWTGTIQAATLEGFRACQRELRTAHLNEVLTLRLRHAADRSIPATVRAEPDEVLS